LILPRTSNIHGYFTDRDREFLEEIDFIGGELDNLHPGFCFTCQVIGRLLDK